MKRNLVVLQEDKNDCAAACLLSIIKYYNGYINMETIRNIINTTRNGTTAYDLINGSKSLGFDSYGKKVSFADIEKETELFPVIAHIRKNNLYHFVVIYKINKKFILYMDPLIGFVKESCESFKTKYLETLIYFSKIKELPKEKNDNKLLKIILKKLIKDRKNIILLSLISLVTFIFSLLDSVYYKVIIDSKISKNLYLKFSLIFISFVIIKNSFLYLRNKLSIKVNHEIEILINKETLKRLFCLPYSYYKNKSTGEITSRLNDLDSLRELLSNLILNTFVDVSLILISFIVMFILNKKITLVTLAILLLYILVVLLFKNKLNTNIKLIQENKGIYNHYLIESIEGIESINNLNIKDIRIKKLEDSYLHTSELTKSLSFSLNIQHFLKNNIYDIGLIILLTLGALLVLENKLSIGDLMLVYMLISYFLNIIRALLDKEIDISYTFKNINKVNSILNNYNSSTKTNYKIKGSIIIKDFCYEYSKESNKININSLLINENDKLLITGKSGSGKSTLIKVILKYINNYKGTIILGEKNLKQIDESIIRNSCVYIGQNEKLFTDTFKNNITLERSVTEYEYEKVLKICELDNLRNSRKFKDNFLIEEDGFNISGGEYQRIILARGLLKDSNYIFIDEALSEVNLNLEKKIVKNILENYKNKTIIYVSHKDEVKELFKKIYNVERRVYERN